MQLCVSECVRTSFCVCGTESRRFLLVGTSMCGGMHAELQASSTFDLLTEAGTHAPNKERMRANVQLPHGTQSLRRKRANFESDPLKSLRNDRISSFFQGGYFVRGTGSGFGSAHHLLLEPFPSGHAFASVKAGAPSAGAEDLGRDRRPPTRARLDAR
eukprot:4701626-Pleurochrysis_carterae.AAC.4